MLDEPLTTGAVTDIAGRVGGAVGAGRSSHATASITTVRESRTVRLTTHLREISKVDSRIGRAGCRVATPSTEGQPSNTRRYAKTAITSGREIGRASCRERV